MKKAARSSGRTYRRRQRGRPPRPAGELLHLEDGRRVSEETEATSVPDARERGAVRVGVLRVQVLHPNFSALTLSAGDRGPFPAHSQNPLPSRSFELDNGNFCDLPIERLDFKLPIRIRHRFPMVPRNRIDDVAA